MPGSDREMIEGELARPSPSRQHASPSEPGVADDPGDALRTPLHAIRCAVDIILAGDAGSVSAEAVALVATIGNAVELLQQSIERRLCPPGHGGGSASTGDVCGHLG